MLRHIPKDKRSEFKNDATTDFSKWLNENTDTFVKEVLTDNFISKDIMQVQFLETCQNVQSKN